MIDFASILKGNPNGVLASQDGQSVRTRVFQYLFADDICTSSQNPIFDRSIKGKSQRLVLHLSGGF